MEVTTLLASGMTEVNTSLATDTLAGVVVGEAINGGEGSMLRAASRKILMLEPAVVPAVPSARTQNFCAAIARGCHSLQYRPTAQQFASWVLHTKALSQRLGYNEDEVDH